MPSFYIYIFGGYYSCRADIRKRKITCYGPIKKPFSPFGKEKGAIGKNKKDYIRLHIIPPKLICIPRSRNVAAVHILQPVGTGS
jgi:hypothetical protein